MERVGKHVKELLEEVVAQEEVQRGERLYSALVEKSFDGVFVQKGPKIIFANKRLCELLGYEKDELKGMDYWLLYHPDYQDLIREQAEASLRGEKVLSQYEVKLQRKDGSLFDGEINASVVSFEGGLVVQVLVRDITEQKQAEEEKKKLEVQLRQAHKMDAISTLAGGIAHDFNNLLMGIQGNASLMLLDIDPGHPYYKRLKNIEEQVQKGAEITRQLLGFARGGKYAVKPTDINELIQKSSERFGYAEKDIKIYSKYQKGIWAVEVDQEQFEHVLLNLFANACQAMPGGGELRIETQNITLDENYTRPYQVVSGRYVKTSVADTGVGMDEVTQQKIFDPFFTTKKMGRGTGLGLASVYGIIKNHGGIINVDSRNGEGSTFSIYLPASEKEL